MIGAVEKKQPTKNGEVEVWRQRLRQALDDRNLDYDEVSVSAGSNAEYVSKMLAGRFNPTVARLMKICEAGGINMAYLFSDDPSEEEQSVLEKAADLSGEDADLVNRLIQSARAK
ncbi:helix-turn-helix domain-containing protein [Rhodobacteraceae bacterium CY05]|uniref:Helix-turn-helix domain-containing protein n=2 Tax=Parasedimentitalea huanghaiensis TaxID=2682100 RepID=A0A6L6WG60_9RHOB|nr:helix-turn-helix domain-containing protein [Zongyanglinia huanghaiensis]